jgi:long-subunit acyl-CoA synthetase (AMP-forming)
LSQSSFPTLTRSRSGLKPTVSSHAGFYKIFVLGKDAEDIKKAMSEPEFKKIIMDELAALAKEHKLSGLEKPKDIYLTDEAFTVENNLLTPTFKLKRNVVREHFAD